MTAVAISAGVLLVYAAHAAVLIAYPWDWSPDEGLSLEHARRLLEAPATLYPMGTAVPFPAAWGPMLPVVLVPAVTVSAASPLRLARLIAFFLAAATTAGIYVAVRRRAAPALAIAASTLALAPMGLSFWYMIVRPDGLMVTLWVWGAVVLLPDRFVAGGGRLTWKRALAASCLLVAAVLSKPTAIVHGLPVVLGWFVVDRPSALRLCAMMVTLGGAAVGVLQVASSGGYLWSQGLWGTHGYTWPQMVIIVTLFAREAAGLFLVVAAAFLLAWRARAVARDGALPMFIGAAMVAPALAKFGAWHNYLVPLVCAMAVLAGRWLGAWAADGPPPVRPRRGAFAALGVAAAALLIVLTTTFPLPARRDEEQASRFYDSVREVGAPLLAFRPEYAYYLVGQPAEVEATGFPYMLASKVPGTELVLRRIEDRRYRAITYFPGLWPASKPVLERVNAQYRPWRQFELGYFYGRTRCLIVVPRQSEDSGRP